MKHGFLSDEHPDLLKEWDYTSNELIGVFPEKATSKSGRKVHWICSKCGYNWIATIASRSSGSGCPVCAHQKVWSGYNDLQTLFPEIAKQFDVDKNGISATEIMPNTAKKYWWKCQKGHSYTASPNTKVNMKTGCPVCSGHKLLSGYNDLQTLFPQISKEWDYSRNEPLTPDMINPGSHKTVYWICDKGHSYSAQISNRVSGTNCPYCSIPAKKILIGFNDLATTNKELLSEWNYAKNERRPEEFLPGSNIRVSWKCSICGNEWDAKIVNRVKGNGCPKCTRIFHTSKAEQIVFYYMKKAFPDTINGYRTSKGDEIDIYVPSLRLGVEYDGERWHSSNEKNDTDIKKSMRITSSGIILIRVREPNCPKILDGSIIIKTLKPTSDWSYLGHTMENLFKEINKMCGTSINIQIDIPKDLPYAIESFKNVSVANSIASTRPDLTKEWDYDKNSPLKPENVPAHSGFKAWWRCEVCGNSWSAVIASRVSGKGCPACGKKRQAKSKQKRVRAIETGQIFDSVKDAAIILGNEKYCSNIANCAKGRKKTAYGLHWEYVDE